MDGTTTQPTRNLSQSHRRSVRAYLASLLWWLTGLLAVSILAFLAAGGMTLVIGGRGL